MRNQMIAMLFTAIARSFLIVSMLANLAACTNTVREDFAPIPKFKSIAIVNQGVADELKVRFGVPPEDSDAPVGALAGAGAGAMAGAEMFQHCWNTPIICALITVPVGAAVGAVKGGLAENAADSQIEMSKEQLVELDDLFAQIIQQRTINEEIESSLMRQIPAARISGIPEADTLLQYRLYDVRFSKTSSEKYALTLKTVMLFKWHRNSAYTQSTSRTYEYTSQSLLVEDWVQDEGKTINLAFDNCIGGLTEMMIEDIQFKEP